MRPEAKALGDTPVQRLLVMMARLRDPQTGCPWDIEQTFKTIAPYTIEEAYEVSDAIDRGDMGELREELGDLLLQVAFHAQMADEQGAFNFDAVADGLVDKMVRRHPHVFGDADERDVQSQTLAWEAQKAQERKAKGLDTKQARTLDGVALALPALMRAEKLQKRAARVGFDWPNPRPVLDKINEESAEVLDAMQKGEPQQRLTEEIGDLLFSVVNLARHLNVDPEIALREANSKFSHRFNGVEDMANAQNKSLSDMDINGLEALWDAVKQAEH